MKMTRDEQEDMMWEQKELAQNIVDTYTKNIMWVNEGGKRKPYYYTETDEEGCYHIIPYYTIDIPTFRDEGRVVLNKELETRH